MPQVKFILHTSGVSSYSCHKNKGTKLEETKMNWSKLSFQNLILQCTSKMNPKHIIGHPVKHS